MYIRCMASCQSAAVSLLLWIYITHMTVRLLTRRASVYYGLSASLCDSLLARGKVFWNCGERICLQTPWVKVWLTSCHEGLYSGSNLFYSCSIRSSCWEIWRHWILNRLGPNDIVHWLCCAWHSIQAWGYLWWGLWCSCIPVTTHSRGPSQQNFNLPTASSHRKTALTSHNGTAKHLWTDTNLIALMSLHWVKAKITSKSTQVCFTSSCNCSFWDSHVGARFLVTVESIVMRSSCNQDFMHGGGVDTRELRLCQK